MKKKQIIFNLILLLVVTVFTFYYMAKSNLISHLDAIGSLAWWKVLLLAGVVFAYILCDAFIISRSMKLFDSKANILDGMGTYLYGNLGSNVTPWKSGHFPLIALYFRKKGRTIEESLTLMINNQLVYSTSLIIVYSVSAIICFMNRFTVVIGEVNLPLGYISLFGLLINIIFFSFCVLVTYNIWFQSFVIKVEAKIKLFFKKIDDMDVFLEEKRMKAECYKKCFKNYFSKFYTYIPSFIAYAIFIVLIFGLPYFIYLLLSNGSFELKTFFYYFALSQSMSYVTNIIPVPGGTGVAEFSFITVFTAAMTDTYVSTAMLIYRILTYFGITVVDFIYFVIKTLVFRKRDKNEIQ